MEYTKIVYSSPRNLGIHAHEAFRKRMATVNISFQDTLLADIDAAAAREHRSRSDLIREAARRYLAQQARWDRIFLLGDSARERSDLVEADVAAEIAAQRAERTGS